MLDLEVDFVYPLVIMVGILLAFFFLDTYFKKKEMPKGLATSLELALVISAMVGFVCAILFQNLYNFIEDPSSYTWTWAMTFYGGAIGGAVTFFLIYFLHLRKKYPPFLDRFLTIAGPGIALAHGFGRIGCFLDGCCYGKETDSIFGMVFVTTNGKKVWPTNLYEAIFLLVLASILLIVAFRSEYKYNFQTYMISYAIFRFCIEFLRGDHRGSFIPGLTPSQFWSILLFLGGVVFLILKIIQNRKNKPNQNADGTDLKQA